MAKVTDIQDKNGATREIQDKDLANRTSQSSIASSDYVLLEDTNGAYHKIAKASFTEAVRGALGSVINSVAKGTDIAKVPVLDSNNDLGMGTLSNLASVLGGLLYIKTGKIPSDQSITVTLGSGLLIMAMLSSVEVDILEYWKEPQIVSEGQSVFSITKTGNTNTYTITPSQNVGGTYIFIGIG